MERTLTIFTEDFYYSVTALMAAMAVIVFIALQRVSAGYGILYTRKWGPTLDNRTGWVAMEAPAFVSMLCFWLLSPRSGAVAPAVMASLFLLHYFQRSFVFPFLIRGKSRMPVAIVVMGVTFNIVNAYLIGGWLFWVAPVGRYTVSWLCDPLFILGAVVFFFGMWVNLQSDYIVRHLRKAGDTRHYIPCGGFYRYVTSANYFGELVEWTGYAILTWSVGGAVFALWTFANLAPRARKLTARYEEEFGDDYRRLHRRHIIPFIY